MADKRVFTGFVLGVCTMLGCAAPSGSGETSANPSDTQDEATTTDTVGESHAESAGDGDSEDESDTSAEGGTGDPPPPPSCDEPRDWRATHVVIGELGPRGSRGPVIDAEGDGFTAWALSDDSGPTYFSRYAVVDDSWTPPALLLDVDAKAGNLQYTMDHTGHLLLVWKNEQGQIMASQLDAGADTVHEPVALFPSETDTAPGFLLTANRQGMALIVARFSATDDERIVERRFDPSGGTWEDPQTVASFPTSDEQVFRVAINESGDGILAWSEGPEAARLLQTSRYDAASRSWASPIQAGDGFGATAAARTIDITGNGDAFLGMQEGQSPQKGMAIRRLLAGEDTWEMSMVLNPNELVFPAQPIHLAFSEAGTGIATWELAGEFTPFQHSDVFENGEWADPFYAAGVEVDPNLSGAVATDECGHSYKAYGLANDDQRWVRVFDRDHLLGEETIINLGPAGDEVLTSARLAVNRSGDIIVTWYNYEGDGEPRLETIARN